MRAPTVGIAMLCVLLAFLAGAGYGAGQARSKVTNLLHESLSERFTPGREVLVDLVDIPPDSRLDAHGHPGAAFHYYLEGDPEISIEGRGTTHLVPSVMCRSRHCTAPRRARPAPASWCSACIPGESPGATSRTSSATATTRYGSSRGL